MPRTSGDADPGPAGAFAGFTSPNFTSVPNEVFDLLLPDLSLAELKVLLYVIRRTFGFGQASDAISATQISEGIRRRDGSVLDRGTGLSRTSVHAGVKALVARGVLEVRQVRDAAGDCAANVYALRFAGEVGQNLTHPRTESEQGWVKNLPTGGSTVDLGVGQNLTPQKKDVQDKVNKNDLAEEELTESPEPFPIPALGLSSAQAWATLMDAASRDAAFSRIEIETWLRTARLAGHDGEALVIEAPNAVARDRLATRMLPRLHRLATATFGAPVALRIMVGSGSEVAA